MMLDARCFGCIAHLPLVIGHWLGLGCQHRAVDRGAGAAYLPWGYRMLGDRVRVVRLRVAGGVGVASGGGGRTGGGEALRGGGVDAGKKPGLVLMSGVWTEARQGRNKG
jgi:hypothetical protein